MQIFGNRTPQRHSYDEQQDDDGPEKTSNTGGAALPQEIKDNTNAFQAPAQKAEDYISYNDNTDDFQIP